MDLTLAVGSPGFCIPTTNTNSCYVVNGETNIFLDSDANSVKDTAYRTIQDALTDSEYIRSFALDAMRAQFLESIRETLVLLPAESAPSGSPLSRNAAVIAITASIVSFVIVGIFLYGVFRRHKPMNSGSRSQQSTNRSTRLYGRRRFFQRLDEEEAITGVIHIKTNLDNPTTTWSVSDITSDSVSVLSSFSKTTSRLEKIEEEPENYFDFDDDGKPFAFAHSLDTTAFPDSTGAEIVDRPTFADISNMPELESKRSQYTSPEVRAAMDAWPEPFSDSSTFRLDTLANEGSDEEEEDDDDGAFCSSDEPSPSSTVDENAENVDPDFPLDPFPAHDQPLPLVRSSRRVGEESSSDDDEDVEPESPTANQNVTGAEMDDDDEGGSDESDESLDRWLRSFLARLRLTGESK